MKLTANALIPSGWSEKSHICFFLAYPSFNIQTNLNLLYSMSSNTWSRWLTCKTKFPDWMQNIMIEFQTLGCFAHHTIWIPVEYYLSSRKEHRQRSPKTRKNEILMSFWVIKGIPEKDTVHKKLQPNHSGAPTVHQINKQHETWRS